MKHTVTSPTRRTTRRFDPEAFRLARQDAGWSLGDLSEATGIPRSTLNKLSQGKRQMPRGATYRRLIRALRLKKGDLLTSVPLDADATEEA